MRRLLLLAGVLLAPGVATAGAFIFSQEGDEDLIVHPTGYTGSGGTREIEVCLRTSVLPGGTTAGQVENTLRKAIDTWNRQQVATATLAFGGNNDVPGSAADFESVLLHELGHCLGLAHPNHASESGLDDPQANGTKSTDGANNFFDQGAGSDGLHGSADDVRGDDGNLYWYRSGSNDPLAYPAIIDTTTFRRTLGGLPGGHSFARNADRDVLEALGVSATESVMQQGTFADEAQRRLTGEDLSTIRLGMSGRDERQGTSDDYSITLDYIGRVNNCDITVEFSSNAGFAFCEVSGAFIGGDHVRITDAALNFSSTTNWYFSQAPTTATTITSDTPDPSAVGASYSVAVRVARAGAAPTSMGTPTGQVEVRDDLGNTCLATLGGSGSAATGSCALVGTVAGERSLRATYLGLGGFDASASASTPHTVGRTSTLTLSDSPATSVVGQNYTVGAVVSGAGPTPTGSVAVSDGVGGSCSISLSGGSGSCTLSGASPGSVTLTGNYSGDAQYFSSSDTEPHLITAASTTTTITAQSPAASVVGEAYQVQVRVAPVAPGTGTPTGSVGIDDGQGASCVAPLSAGSGSCFLTSGTAGALTLSANYGGSSHYLASTGTAAHPVSSASTSTAIVSDSPDPSASGAAVTVVFLVSVNSPGSGLPGGTVTVTSSTGAPGCSATLPQDRCSLTLTTPGAGTLSASYGGDARFQPSSDVEAHTVLAQATTTQILSDLPDPSRVGEAVAVTVAVLPVGGSSVVPGGEVTVRASAEESCSFVLPGTGCSLVLRQSGARILTASYGGDSVFGASSDTETHAVQAAQTATTIESVLPQPSAVGQPYVVRARADALAPGAGVVGGSIVVQDSLGGSCAATLVDGAMSCSIVPEVLGTRSVQVQYAGSSDFDPSSTSVTHSVKAAPGLAIVAVAPSPSTPGETVVVSITAPGDGVSGVPGGEVSISSAQEATSCSITLPATSCSLTLTVEALHTLRADYGGDATYGAASATIVQPVGDFPLIFADGFEP